MTIYGQHDGSGNVTSLESFEYTDPSGNTVKVGFRSSGSTSKTVRVRKGGGTSLYLETGDFGMKIESLVNGCLDVTVWDPTGVVDQAKGICQTIQSCQNWARVSEEWEGRTDRMPLGLQVCTIKDALICISALGGATNVSGWAGTVANLVNNAKSFASISCEDVAEAITNADHTLTAIDEYVQDWLDSLDEKILGALRPVTVTETENAFVVHMPLTSASQAARLAGDITDAIGSLTYSGWGSEEWGFGIQQIDWTEVVHSALSKAKELGGNSDVVLHLKPYHRVGTGLVNTDAQLRSSDDGGVAVGVLPVVAVIPADQSYLRTQGLDLSYALWLEYVPLGSCQFDPPRLWEEEDIPLLNAAEVRAMSDAGEWEGHCNWIVAKLGVHTMRSTVDPPWRWWFFLQATDSQVIQVKCLTYRGLWPPPACNR